MYCKSYAAFFIAALIQYGISHGCAGSSTARLPAQLLKHQQSSTIPVSAVSTSGTNTFTGNYSLRRTNKRTCPPWFIGSSGDCECDKYNDGIVSCDKDTNRSYIMVCYCMTYTNGKATVTYFLQSCFLRTRRYTKLIPLPNTTKALEELMCGRIHRRGQLCGSCEQNHSFPVYSYYLGCIYCPKGSGNWIKYILAAFLPLTAFCIGMLVFRISANSGYLAGFVLVSQFAASPLQLRAVVAVQNDKQFPLCTTVGTKLILSLYGIWNLDFFRLFYSPFCLYPGMNTLSTLALDYLIAIYPLFLVLVTYVLVRLHDRGFRLIVWLWKPFRQWDATTSLIDAFATFLLLSQVKIISVSYDLLAPIPVHFINGTKVPNLVLNYDASVEYFGPNHLPYGLLALGVLSVFVLIPLLLLFVYPCRCFQRILGSCNRGCFTLHTFMDAFQGAFKNGTNQTRDCRYFAALFLLVRIFILGVTGLHNVEPYSAVSLVLICFITAFAFFKPFKVEQCNTITIILLLICAGSCVTLAYVNQTLNDPGKIHTIIASTLIVMVIPSPLVYINGLILVTVAKIRKVQTVYHKIQAIAAAILHKRTSEPLTNSLPHRVTHGHQYMQRPLLPTTGNEN